MPIAAKFCVLLSLIGLLLCSEQGRAEDRTFALVVGVGTYADEANTDEYNAAWNLARPEKDAAAVHAAMSNIGFEMQPMLSKLDEPSIRKAVDGLARKVRDASTNGDRISIALYFSGHGLQHSQDGQTLQYLIPRGAPITRNDADQYIDLGTLTSLAAIRQKLANSGATQIWIILDVCRVPAKGQSVFKSRSLTPISQTPDTITTEASVLERFLFATSPGQPAYESDPEEFSLFTQKFLEGLAWAEDSEALENYLKKNIQDANQIPDTNGGRLRISWKRKEAAIGTIDVPAFKALASGKPDADDAHVVRNREAKYVKIDPNFDVIETVKSIPLPMILEKAKAGDALHKYYAGIAYAIGHETAIDFVEAQSWLEEAIADGVYRAINSLAYMYNMGELKGISTEADKTRAVRLWQSGAERGQPNSMLNLAYAFLDGSGGKPKDIKQAVDWLDEAAKLGYPLAYETKADWHMYGKIGAPDAKTAISLYEKAVELRLPASAASATKIATIYEYGRSGIPVDEFAATNWYSKATDLGDGVAARFLIDRADNGVGFDKPDPETGTKFALRAAELNNVEAMQILATRLFNGIGTRPDIQTGLTWLEKSAKAGNGTGRYSLAFQLYELGNPAQKEDAKLKLAEIFREEITSPNQKYWPMDYYLAGLKLSQVMHKEGLQKIGGIDRTELALYYDDTHAKWTMKKFTVPITCLKDAAQGAKTPFHIYVFDWPRAQDMVLPQLEWVERERGCEVPQDVKDSFQKLFALARENKASFAGLTVDAFSAVQAETAKTSGSH